MGEQCCVPQDFLRKEFSEENILFWQACEGLTHVPAHDHKEVRQAVGAPASSVLASAPRDPPHKLQRSGRVFRGLGQGGLVPTRTVEREWGCTAA